MIAAEKSAGLTPPEISRRLVVDVAEVLGWIHAGELVAHNLSVMTGGRPRWRIDPDELRLKAGGAV